MGNANGETINPVEAAIRNYHIGLATEQLDAIKNNPRVYPVLNRLLQDKQLNAVVEAIHRQAESEQPGAICVLYAGDSGELPPDILKEALRVAGVRDRTDTPEREPQPLGADWAKGWRERQTEAAQRVEADAFAGKAAPPPTEQDRDAAVARQAGEMMQKLRRDYATAYVTLETILFRAQIDSTSPVPTGVEKLLTEVLGAINRPGR